MDDNSVYIIAAFTITFSGLLALYLNAFWVFGKTSRALENESLVQDQDVKEK